MSKKLTHIDKSGKAVMVDISSKNNSERSAKASGRVIFTSEVYQKLTKEGFISPKGSIVQTAVIAGIQGVKRTSYLIPLCHQIPLSKIDIKIKPLKNSLFITCEVSCNGKTGVEMEALTAASIAALTVYDMCKSFSKNLIISEIKLLKKTGGKSGNWSKLIDMNDRFIRQTVLKEFGIKSQEILSNSRVLVVGCGGLGIPVIQYLNATNFDVVVLQELFDKLVAKMYENDIGKSKVNSAIAKLKIQNSRTKLKGYNFFINNKNAFLRKAFFCQL